MKYWQNTKKKKWKYNFNCLEIYEKSVAMEFKSSYYLYIILAKIAFNVAVSGERFCARTPVFVNTYVNRKKYFPIQKLIKYAVYKRKIKLWVQEWGYRSMYRYCRISEILKINNSTFEHRYIIQVRVLEISADTLKDPPFLVFLSPWFRVPLI